MAKARLYKLVRDWEHGIRDPRDAYAYLALLDELLFQAELRYCDYIQYQSDGMFLIRLEEWLANLPQKREQQMLFRLLEYFIFIDDLQMTALYRDAFRRVIAPWLTPTDTHIDDFVAPEFTDRLRARIAKYQVCSISESFDVGLLLKANDLHGIPRPVILGPDQRRAIATFEALDPNIAGLVVCEDIVGTGRQASKILAAIEARAPAHWRMIFVPLIAFQDSLIKLQKLRTTTRPVVVLPSRSCLKEKVQAEEPPVFKAVRGIVKNTAARVTITEDEFDDPPRNPFGYEGCGGLIVTCHNAPNNTLALIHHKAPSWQPLFRRLHHKERAS